MIFFLIAGWYVAGWVGVERHVWHLLGPPLAGYGEQKPGLWVCTESRPYRYGAPAEMAAQFEPNAVFMYPPLPSLPRRAAPRSSSSRAAAGRQPQQMAGTCPCLRTATSSSRAAPAYGRQEKPRASGALRELRRIDINK